MRITNSSVEFGLNTNVQKGGEYYEYDGEQDIEILRTHRTIWC